MILETEILTFNCILYILNFKMDQLSYKNPMKRTICYRIDLITSNSNSKFLCWESQAKEYLNYSTGIIQKYIDGWKMENGEWRMGNGVASSTSSSVF